MTMCTNMTAKEKDSDWLSCSFSQLFANENLRFIISVCNDVNNVECGKEGMKSLDSRWRFAM